MEAAGGGSSPKGAARKHGADAGAAQAGGIPSAAHDAEPAGRVTRREATRRSEAKAAAAVETETIRKGNLARLGCVLLRRPSRALLAFALLCFS